MSNHLNVAFIWHMHQPWYQDPATGTLTLPWVRLHAAKDYVDMVALVEEFPAVHQTFNLSPCLLEQVAWYGQGHRDAWESLAGQPADSLNETDAAVLARQCTFAHPQRMVLPHPPYALLVDKVRRGQRLRAGELRDLTVWFHLVWTDPRWRRTDPVLTALVEKGRAFTESEKADVLARHRALLDRMVPAYRAAQDLGHVELTASPYAHPILPLLIDSAVARAATPDLPLPDDRFASPEDMDDHLRRAVELFGRTFGRPPQGLWPSEGAVSEAIVPAVAGAGFRWMATDEALLWKSWDGSAARAALYRPYRVSAGGASLAVVFRDRILSDLIGFSYASQPAAAAADDFLRRLRVVRDEAAGETPLVTVILDGENAWEHYPGDGEEFLRRVYDGVSRDPSLSGVTVSEHLAAHPPTADLPRLAPGSWIRGDFTTWIGDPEKNAAWERLTRARAAYAAAASHPRAAEARRALRMAEGSDWFWWYGPEHHSAHDEEFDRLFRQQLVQVYTTLGLAVPPALRAPTPSAPAGEPVPPSRWITPTMDGVVSDYFEWLYAGRWDCAWARGAMAPGQDRLQRFWWGCDAVSWYVRLDLATWPGAEPLTITCVSSAPPFRAVITLAAGAASAVWARPDGAGQGAALVAAERIVEAKFPLEALGLRPGMGVTASLRVEQEGVVLETLPASGEVTFLLPGESDEQTLWSA